MVLSEYKNDRKEGASQMNELELQIKTLIIERYGSLKKFSDTIEMPWTTLDSILKRGVSNSNITNVLKITRELGLDAEELVSGNISESIQEPTTVAAHLDTDDLTQDELDDVATYIEFIKNKRKN